MAVLVAWVLAGGLRSAPAMDFALHGRIVDGYMIQDGDVILAGRCAWFNGVLLHV